LVALRSGPHYGGSAPGDPIFSVRGMEYARIGRLGRCPHLLRPGRWTGSLLPL